MKTLLIIRPEGTLDSDETFSSEHFGTFNVTALRRAILAGKVPAIPVMAVIDEKLMDSLKGVDTNEARIAALTPEDLLEPILLVTNVGNTEHDLILDGHHRVKRLWRDGQRSVRVVAVGPKVGEAFRIIFAQVDETGKLEEISHAEMASSGHGHFPQHNPDGSHKRYSK